MLLLWKHSCVQVTHLAGEPGVVRRGVRGGGSDERGGSVATAAG
jgi:hypothetical protein